ncbi:hypothetical protein [Mycetocola zhujimingii]|uniref:Exo-alpha-sialidase n=1 Tax=Mycetocola zhujimingii TaxID=2079792 RepID=A0A2U1TFN6_9MICO|nr:hypothetical protein [Mycetocola zhujimingii]PWC07593.1 hypothetical protein DF223_06045 [Mycetocola zhujimingii]
MAHKAFVRRPQREGLSKRWSVIGLSLFVVLDVLLVGAALDAQRGPEVVEQIQAVPSSPPSAEPTATAAVSANAVRPQRVLAAASGDVAWRGTIGPCPGGTAALEYTDDGGATWKTVDPAAETGAAAVVRVVPESESAANVVTLDAGCSPQLVGTFVAGDAWADHSPRLGSYWYLDPKNVAAIQSPAGMVAAPCSSAVMIATRSTDEAAVLCADETVFRTTDAGSTWSAAIFVPGAVALSGAPDGYIAAVAGQGECGGTSVLAITDSRPGALAGCAGETSAPGQTVVSVSDDGTFWLWSGDVFARSTDGGLTWK